MVYKKKSQFSGADGLTMMGTYAITRGLISNNPLTATAGAIALIPATVWYGLKHIQGEKINPILPAIFGSSVGAGVSVMPDPTLSTVADIAFPILTLVGASKITIEKE